METTNLNQDAVSNVVTKVVTFLQNAPYNLNTDQVKIKRNIFRKAFDSTGSVDQRMIEVHTRLLELGYILVSVDIGENTDYYITASRNSLYLNANLADSKVIEKVLNHKPLVLSKIQNLLALKLSPSLTAKSVCDIAGHSNISRSVISKTNNKVKCYRCGAVIKPSTFILMPKGTTNTLTGYNTTSGLKYVPYSQIDILDLIGKSDFTSPEDHAEFAILHPFLDQETVSMCLAAGLEVLKKKSSKATKASVDSNTKAARTKSKSPKGKTKGKAKPQGNADSNVNTKADTKTKTDSKSKAKTEAKS